MYCLSESLTLAQGGFMLASVAKTTGSTLIELWSSAWPILLLIFGFGLVIFVHELGHFVAAKAVGIKVEVFALGFGPRLLGFKRGETDYRISAVPLGGYIKMLGQDDSNPGERVDDPRSYGNKTVGQRLVVIAAGVIMNLIFACLMFIILFRFVGVEFQRAEVGAVGIDSPAEVAGVLPGDTILAVNGKKVEDFGEVIQYVALAPGGEDISLTIRRVDRETPFDLAIRPETDGKMGILHIGIAGPFGFRVAEPRDYKGAQGLEEGDVIVGLEYDKQIHTYDKFYEFEAAVRARRAKPTNIIATRKGKKLDPIMLRPRLAAGSHIMGLLTPARIVSVTDKSVAQKAGIKPGDIIRSLDGYAWPDTRAVAKICQRASKEHKEIPISVLRAGETIELRASIRKGYPLGIGIEPDYHNLYVANDYRELYGKEDKFQTLDLPDDLKIDVPAEAKLSRINGEPLADWSDLIDKLEARAGSKAKLAYALDDKTESVSFQIPTSESSIWREQWQFAINLHTAPDKWKVKTDSLTGATYIGLHKTWFWLRGTYLTLTRLMQGSVKTTALSGPVGIANIGMKMARDRGPAYFFYFMAIIGVNLAIINFLPIPVLDGGHALFLLVEKVKGSPVSVRVQTVATTLSMGLIGVFFLLITYQDIMRWVGIG